MTRPLRSCHDYTGTDSDFAGRVNDARDWKAALQARGYTVTTLLDQKATHDAILADLTKLLAGAKSVDSRVFTFSGHDSWMPERNGDETDQRDEMLCPWDIGRNRWLLDDDLAQVLGRTADGVRRPLHRRLLPLRHRIALRAVACRGDRAPAAAAALPAATDLRQGPSRPRRPGAQTEEAERLDDARPDPLAVAPVSAGAVPVRRDDSQGWADAVKRARRLTEAGSQRQYGVTAMPEPGVGTLLPAVEATVRDGAAPVDGIASGRSPGNSARLPGMRALRRIDVSPAAGGTGEPESLDLHPRRAVLALEMEDDFVLYATAGRLADDLRRLDPTTSESGAVNPDTLLQGGTSCGLGTTIVKALSVIGIDAGAVLRIEEQRQPGLVEALVAEGQRNARFDLDSSLALFRLPGPVDLQEMLQGSRSIVQVLDKSTADLP